MKLLITGANGQLGQDLQKECDRRGIEYIATDYLAGSTMHVARGTNDSYDELRATSHERNVDSTNLPNCQSADELLHLDITDLKSVRETVLRTEPDAIVNCAAYNAVDKAEEDWKNAFLVNAIGPKNLAIAAGERGIPLMHFSTDYVFMSLTERREVLTSYGMSQSHYRYTGKASYMVSSLSHFSQIVSSLSD